MLPACTGQPCRPRPRTLSRVNLKDATKLMNVIWTSIHWSGQLGRPLATVQTAHSSKDQCGNMGAVICLQAPAEGGPLKQDVRTFSTMPRPEWYVPAPPLMRAAALRTASPVFAARERKPHKLNKTNNKQNVPAPPWLVSALTHAGNELQQGMLPARVASDPSFLAFSF